MAFSERLAQRVRDQLAHSAVTDKKMFWGLVFFINGNLSVGVHGNELIVRMAPDSADRVLAQPGARPFDITGRPMKGSLLVGEPGVKNLPSLRKWVQRGIEYAASLPKKA